MIELDINGKQISVPEGTTLLEAARRAGIHIPTLCNLEGHEALGACRVCLVEVAGFKTLVASCSTLAAEGMQVRTFSPRVREARRTVVELLLSEHARDCPTCPRNGSCELQEIAREMGITVLRYTGERTQEHVDASTPGLRRDNGACIKCRRCVTACTEIQGVGAIFPQGRGFATVIGPAFTRDLDTVACVQCGQCAAVCPVGAITELSHRDRVWRALADPKKHVIVQTAPAIRAALGECFGLEPGTLVTGKMTTALRMLGFAAVFDTNFAADLTIVEEGNELLARLRTALADGGKTRLPMFTSCSPGWVKFAEYFFPEFLPNISSCKSPQQMFGAVAKTYYAGKAGLAPEELYVVSVMPCTAKKFEAGRPEMNASGTADVDAVLTTRELGEMIREAGIDFVSLPDGTMDAPLGISSGAADIFANTGGVMEAAARTVYAIVTGRNLPTENLHITPLAGLEGIKEVTVTIEGTVPDWSFLEGVSLKLAVAHGLGNARRLMERIRRGETEYHFVEIMTCPGGCIGGGGQPRFTTDEIRLRRIEAIYREDEGKPVRTSHENPAIVELYRDFLGVPLGERSHHLLHTGYTARERV